jgi:RimJ/RimL family protein N-acetyltransferase
MTTSDKKLITFRLATLQDKQMIREWWTKPHVMEFWDNSPEMWQNVENYFQGKKEIFDYWIGSYDQEPFALLMTSELEMNLTEEDPYAKWVEPEGLTITIDFMIGNEKFIGKKLSYLTLHQFAHFMKDKQGINAVIIDPAATNPKAVHVYQKAGFEIVDTFDRNKGYFSGIKHYMMKMKL